MRGEEKIRRVIDKHGHGSKPLVANGSERFDLESLQWRDSLEPLTRVFPELLETSNTAACVDNVESGPELFRGSPSVLNTKQAVERFKAFS